MPFDPDKKKNNYKRSIKVCLLKSALLLCNLYFISPSVPKMYFLTKPCSFSFDCITGIFKGTKSILYEYLSIASWACFRAITAGHQWTRPRPCWCPTVRVCNDEQGVQGCTFRSFPSPCSLATVWQKFRMQKSCWGLQ